MNEIRGTDWHSWAIRPPNRLWAYAPETVVPAFEGIPAISDESSSSTVYHQLLKSFGHNHSGTPYPAVVPAVSFLVRMVPFIDGWSLRTVLEVLSDCLLWSHDEPEFVGPDRAVQRMGQEVVDACGALMTVIEPLTSSYNDHLREIGFTIR